MAENILWQDSLVTTAEREKCLGQKGCVIWLTGLSGSGKSTVARALEKALIDRGSPAYILDGDNVRHGLNADLGFSPEDRTENIRRIGEVAALFAESGMIAVTAFISPYRKDRLAARKAAGVCPFLEVHLKTPVDVCEDRDPKGLYKKVRAGKIANFTGIDAPYEAPESPELVLETQDMTVEEEVEALIKKLLKQGIL